MSLWTAIRDTVESAVSTITPFDVRGESARKQTGGIGGAANSVRNYEEGAFNKVTGRSSEDDKRNQQYMLNDQIKAYKDQTDLAEKELASKQAEKAVVKRQVNEKQIRALRNSYRPAGGFLASTTQAPTLGNQGDQQTKLGA